MTVDTRPPARPLITVVGVGAEGWDGLPERTRRLVLDAGTVLGGRRHLAMLPERPGQRREPWPSPLRERLPDLLRGLGDGSGGPWGARDARDRRGPADASGARGVVDAGGSSDPGGLGGEADAGGDRAGDAVGPSESGAVVALASGDPFVSGIGTTLVDLLGPDTVRVEPAVSSVSLARARMNWSAERCTVVSLVGRDARLILPHLGPRRRLLVLSSGPETPARVAALLTGAGHPACRMTVLADLGADHESRIAGTADDWCAVPPDGVPALHVLALETVDDAGYGSAPGLPDDAFESDGQLTRRDLRASALARLAPFPGGHLWDVGAGAGSVGIEWMRADPSCTATAVEVGEERAARIRRNAGALGVPGLEVVHGRAPDALEGRLPAPDAVFLGGGATRPGVLDACLDALRPGGRLVVHGVTLETEQLLADAYRARGGELTRIAVETAAPVGTFTGWTPARAVTQWALTL